ncbi:hypothetical protein [Rhodoblastus sp.]|uniref:hypothetical protein n=1 Tax=Rhodoblastus sp. TaxID=1962975 RepID=UPI003F95767B
MMMATDKQIAELARALKATRPSGNEPLIYASEQERLAAARREWRKLVNVLREHLDDETQDKLLFAIDGGERLGWAKYSPRTIKMKTRLASSA